MKPLRNPIVAGAAAIALLGITGLAIAKIDNAHVLDVRLADGSMAHIQYFGDTPPTVSLAPAPMTLPILLPRADPLGPESFLALERMSEALDRQADAMFAAERADFAGPIAIPAYTENLHQNAHGFSMISTLSANGVCTRSVDYRSLGDGAAPQIVTRTSGACQTSPQRPSAGVAARPVAEGGSTHGVAQTA